MIVDGVDQPLLAQRVALAARPVELAGEAPTPY